ncbi:hypothetical protein [Streptomyces sp. NPDC047968]|uniref:hypothetical protein n=1 Tax=unclassified Streptomyces TaxID=2593676 RepID=UPI003438B135
MEPSEQPPQPLHPAEVELLKLRAGLAAGLTAEQSARLQGATADELTADATAFAAELGAGSGAPRSGGPRGGDVGGGTRAVSAGAALYRQKHGLDDEGRRPVRAPRPMPDRSRNPFAEPSYTIGEG